MQADLLTTVAVDGAQIVYRRIGKGRPLLILNGFAATSSDWDLSFIDRLVSSNELILLNNRGMAAQQTTDSHSTSRSSPMMPCM
jgi:pimeloyl-ACP methyl ester carboxylesterase